MECICGNQNFEKKHQYKSPPVGEITISLQRNKIYHRDLFQCDQCGHFLSISNANLDDFYIQDYINSTYSKKDLKSDFQKIISLDPKMSDNIGRVKKINSFVKNFFGSKNNKERPLSVLDIGSGLCVFLYQMKEWGWNCTALDPDVRAFIHAKEFVKVEAIHGDFNTVEINQSFDLITFNKVLEHVKNPIAMLQRSKKYLNKGGIVYLELPDGEMACQDSIGFSREEFFIEHFHIFSKESLIYLVKKSGFIPKEIERLVEPSSKYTLRSFLIAGD